MRARYHLWAVLGLQFVATPVAGQSAFPSRCGAGTHAEAPGWGWLPQDRIFCPLTADPKAGHSYASYLRGDFATIADSLRVDDTNIASVGLGDSFGILRVAARRPGDGLQLDLEGGIFAQFNLDEPSFDLINADYLVGLPLTFRKAGFSTRLRVYHQSSHLGDEFLLSRQPERENFTFESLELILSQETGPLRIYMGGEHFFRWRPNIEFVSRLVHGGIELRPTDRAARVVAALDVKIVEQVDWQVAWSARAGLELARMPSPGHPARVISLLGQYYSGPAPYGQFYRDDFRFIGFGFHLSL